MGKIRLYDYQQEMLAAVVRELTTAASGRFLDERGKKVRGGSSVMVQMPTGTGKTYVMAAVVKWFLDSHDTGEVWIVAHRRELVEQMQHTLDRFSLEYGEKDAALDVGARIRVLSIQWLGRHLGELERQGCQPGLIVVDEAHHTIADSYQDLFERNRLALRLGMTATPCRMKKSSFGKLFERLLMSPCPKDFIRRGYLAPYDYVVVGRFSADQMAVDSLKGRGSDGDYSVREMGEKLNVPQGIRRLYESVRLYAGGKRGIVYAIDIDHARVIAEYYQRMGIRAVALDSRTPAGTRLRMVERFMGGALDCLVNVNLFDEGFDCPDVEFIQMARPTLSLAKYLQMVGRGLRVNKADREKVCMIIDNVGNYRKFGLPDKRRDWAAMFAGIKSGRGTVPPSVKSGGTVEGARNDMVMVAQYGKNRQDMTQQQRKAYLQNVEPYEEAGRWGLRVGEDIILRPMYRMITDFVGDFAAFELSPGKWGILIRSGRIYLPPEYKRVEIHPDNTAMVTGRTLGSVPVVLNPDRDFDK